jgi:hypothetical protein
VSGLVELDSISLRREVFMAQGASGRHTSSADSFSLEAFLDWLAPIVVLIVIGGMIFALIGTMLAPVE